MTLAEFDKLPRKLGWTYELVAGQVRMSPSPYTVATLRLPLTSRAGDSRWPVRPLAPKDQPGLIRLFYLAFKDSVEYHGCSLGYVRKRAEESVTTFLQQPGQPWFSAARLIAEGSKIVAAVLVRPCKRGPILEPLMVRPSHQRQGLATALLAPMLHALLDLGATELFSQCHLANEMSWNWHRRFGFEELPDEWVASHRARWLRHELERREGTEVLSVEERRELLAQTEFWEAEAERLRLLSQRDFQGTHPQLM
jgi:predicted N-acetyltransferase YhbS